MKPSVFEARVYGARPQALSWWLASRLIGLAELISGAAIIVQMVGDEAEEDPTVLDDDRLSDLAAGCNRVGVFGVALESLGHVTVREFSLGDTAVWIQPRA